MTTALAGLQIGKLRIRTHSEASATRAQIERVFAIADLEPRNLPKQAILCIRRVRANISRDWENETRQTLETIARQAVRPFRDPVPPQCNAIVFLDFSELLACLAHDFCAGRIAASWWWKRLIAGPDIFQGVLGLLSRSPEYLPNALEMISRRGFVVDFVRLIPDEAAEQVFESLKRTFGLSAVIASERSRSATGLITRDVRTREISKPQTEIAPEACSPHLSRSQRLLLGTALSIHRSPRKVRSPEFQSWLAIWSDGELVPPPTTPFIQGTRGASVLQVAPEAPGMYHESSEKALSPPVSAEQSATVAPSESETLQPKDPRARAADLESATTTKSVPNDSPLLAGIGPTARPCPPASTSTIVDSGYAGLFYLINVGLALDLYVDFTRPEETRIDLLIWDFLAILAEDLADTGLHEDPVWKLLADLSAREVTESPGIGFVPHDEWRIPTTWLQAFDNNSGWSWSDSQGRFELIHPSGFHAVDSALEQTTYQQLRRAADWYGLDLTAISNVSSTQDGSLLQIARWRHHLRSYIHARLGPLALILCKRSGHIELAPAHLDVTYSHDELPIAIRLAGLDRDPGWVPAAARFIRFHYE